MQPRILTLLCVGLVASTAPSIVPAVKAQVLNCANVQVDPRTGVASCAGNPTNQPASSDNFFNQFPLPTAIPNTPSSNPSPFGSGSNSSTNPSLTNGLSTNSAIDYQSPSQPTAITAKIPVSKYDQLALGMSLEQVQLVLGGQPGRPVDQQPLPNGRSQTAYAWQFSDGEVQVYFINGQLSAKSSSLANSKPASSDPTSFLATPATPGNSVFPYMPSATAIAASGPVNYDAYGQLADGMNFAQAVNILGSLGREVVRNQGPTGEPVVVYKWQASQGSITLIFQGDRLVQKAQCAGCSF